MSRIARQLPAAKSVKEGFSARALGVSGPCDTLILDIWHPACARICCYRCKPLSLGYFVVSCPINSSASTWALILIRTLSFKDPCAFYSLAFTKDEVPAPNPPSGGHSPCKKSTPSQGPISSSFSSSLSKHALTATHLKILCNPTLPSTPLSFLWSSSQQNFSKRVVYTQSHFLNSHLPTSSWLLSPSPLIKFTTLQLIPCLKSFTRGWSTVYMHLRP